MEPLTARRAQLYTHSTHGNALAEFKAYLGNVPEDDRAADAAAVDRVYAGWEALPGDKKRAIAGAFRIEVLKGGNGAERVKV